jgi:hypothetical protein
MRTLKKRPRKTPMSKKDLKKTKTEKILSHMEMMIKKTHLMTQTGPSMSLNQRDTLWINMKSMSK